MPSEPMERSERDALIVQLHNEGVSNQQIAARVGLSGTRVGRILKAGGGNGSAPRRATRSSNGLTPEGVTVKLEAEVKALDDEIKRLRSQLSSAQREYDRAWAAEDKIHPDSPIPPKVAHRTAAASRRLGGTYDEINSLRRKIERLRHPAEIEKRLATAKALGDLRARKAEEVAS